MSKHSPGPWKVQRRIDCMHCIEVTGSVLNERGEIQSRIELLPDDPADRHCHFIDAGGDDVIAVNAGPQDELLIDPADARLIVAAPEMLELLREFWSAGQVMVECMKCHNAQVGPDGKTVVANGVMVPLGPGERWNPSLFNPLLPDEDGIRGRCPRCGRANYRYTDDDDQWEDRAADAFAKLAALLARIDG